VEGRDGVPVQRVCVGREEVLNCGKRLAQLVEQLAQVITSLGLGCVRPEEEGQVLTLLGNIAMQHEIGEQGLQARGIEAGHLLVIVEQAEIAKQAEVKGWLHRDLLDFHFSNERATRSFQPADAQRSHDQAALQASFQARLDPGSVILPASMRSRKEASDTSMSSPSSGSKEVVLQKDQVPNRLRRELRRVPYTEDERTRKIAKESIHYFVEIGNPLSRKLPLVWFSCTICLVSLSLSIWS